MPRHEKTDSTIANNRKAHFHYEILEQIEAGVVLSGSEVKSMRENSCSINESFVGEMAGEATQGALFLFNANIPIYKQARSFNHEPRAPRKLLVHKREARKWLTAVQQKGMTIVPLSLFFNRRGLVKVRIALAKGKNVVDKRATVKEREWQIDRARILKSYNS